jgi:hypothetical protein
MQIEALVHLLPKFQTCDCIVTFSDGDSYKIADLDIQGYFENDFEIRVEFDRCLRSSVAMQEALESGYLRTERVGWTSQKPFVPVAKTYLIQDIQSIFDQTENYDVFSKNA